MTPLASLIVPCQFDPVLWSNAELGRVIHRAAQSLYRRDDQEAQSALAELPEELAVDLRVARLICELWTHNQQRDTDGALALYERTRELIDPSTPLGAYAQYQAAIALVATHRYEEALELLAVSEYTFREFDENVALGLTYAVVGGALSDLGDMRASVKYFAASHEILSVYGSDRQNKRASINLVFAYAVIGRYDDALQLANRLYERLTDSTEPAEQSLVLGRLEYCCELLGRYEEALTWNAKHIELARKHEQHELLICLEIDRAYFATRQKHYDEAERILTTIPEASEVGASHYKVRWAFTRGLLALERGNSEVACSAFEETIQHCVSNNLQDELRLRIIKEIVELTQTQDGLPRPDFAATYIELLQQRVREVDHVSSDIIDAHGRYAARLAQYRREREVQLHTTILEAGEQSRRELAVAIHDGAGQQLALVGMHLDAILHEVPQDDPLRGKLTATRLRVGETANDLRTISHALSTHNLERDGLPTAVYNLAADVRSTSRINVLCYIEESLSSLPFDLAHTIYRTVQTLVTNALRHAIATTIDISVTADAEFVVVRVSDDGVGVPVPTPEDGMGWKSVRARATLRGGSFTIASEPSGGTTATVTFSLPSIIGTSQIDA